MTIQTELGFIRKIRMVINIEKANADYHYERPHHLGLTTVLAENHATLGSIFKRGWITFK
jgi:hypothetical protein